MTDIINRTLRLLTDSPGAAVTFYKNAYLQLSVNSISRLIAALMKCLCFFVVEEKKKNCEDVGNISLLLPEGDPIEYKGSGLSSTAMMATIAESVSILWESVSVLPCQFVGRRHVECESHILLKLCSISSFSD